MKTSLAHPRTRHTPFGVRLQRYAAHVFTAVALVATGIVVATCARNPVTGKTQLALISEQQEIEMGKQAADEARQALGVVDDQALQAYVSSLGMLLARASERPNVPWQFTVVEDPAVNAFALPGGPVFVTRGILVAMTSEAELVSVLGHEIGHITARHSVQQISRQQLAQIGLVGAIVLKPELAQFGDLLSSGLGLLFLKFSRENETQADELGFKYMTAHGYNPNEMAEMFHTLERMSASAGARVPEWQSTHPDPGNRVAATRARIAAQPALAANTKVDRDEFLRHLDGIVYGANPRNGFFRGTSFLHPDLKFQLDFPNGWTTDNQAAQVAAISPQQDAIVVLTLAGNAAPATALRQFLSQQGIQDRGTSTSAVNGLPAATGAFIANTRDGTVAGWVSFVSYGGNTYRILGYTPSSRVGAYTGTLQQSIGSFRALTDPTALNAKPQRVRLVRIDRAMNIDEFNGQYPSVIPIDKLALINGVERADRIPAGSLVKRVVAE
jgi:predicted Zn-dependent protease